VTTSSTVYLLFVPLFLLSGGELFESSDNEVNEDCELDSNSTSLTRRLAELAGEVGEMSEEPDAKGSPEQSQLCRNRD
jgi:hypothetical protein